eukprot:3327926-Alexandrium_andersonii.AAC.1
MRCATQISHSRGNSFAIRHRTSNRSPAPLPRPESLASTGLVEQRVRVDHRHGDLVIVLRAQGRQAHVSTGPGRQTSC